MDFDVNDFRRRYPEFKPYEGENYEMAQQHNCALLVIGESHYLPDYSTIHKDCNAWYASDHTKLNEEERKWINISDQINGDLEKGFNKSRWIWKLGYQKINQYGPTFADFRTLFKYTVCYDFFLRPANMVKDAHGREDGQSIAKILTPKDKDIANANFRYMIEHYKPNGVVFLSRLAFDNCREKSALSIPIAGTPHPSCCWWNRKCGKYGGRKGHDLVRDGMVGMDWSWTKQS